MRCTDVMVMALVIGPACVVTLAAAQTQPAKPDGKVPDVLSFRMHNIDGKEVDLSQYKGSVLVLVNVASECGLTPQYKDLEALYSKHEKQGLKILAFPANNFGSQEPGSNEQIKEFCSSEYDVTFDLFAKVSVKGDDQCDLYKYLTDSSTNGELGGEIRWNFTKFIVDRDGQVVARVEPRVRPLDPQVTALIQQALDNKPIKRQVIAKGS